MISLGGKHPPSNRLTTRTNSRYAAHNGLRFFADRAAKKWPLRGSLKLGQGACNLPSMTDGLSTLYQDLLGGSYDCGKAIGEQALAMLRSFRKRGSVEQIGLGRAVQWRLAAAAPGQ